MQQTNYIIEVQNVSKYFGEKVALDNINLKVKKGEFVTILGPSGCGKTTLLRLIAGFQTASEGEIRIAGQEITQTPPHQRPVNTVFQKYALFPHLNVYDNIAFGLKLKKLPAPIIEKKVKGALKMVGMTDYEYRDVDSLSGGQQQRVAIARAIVNNPEVLLLDEPLVCVTGLEPGNMYQFKMYAYQNGVLSDSLQRVVNLPKISNDFPAIYMEASYVEGEPCMLDVNNLKAPYEKLLWFIDDEAVQAPLLRSIPAGKHILKVEIHYTADEDVETIVRKFEVKEK